MNNDKFSIFFERHIGIGLRWQEWNGGFNLSLALPFITVNLIIGAK